MSVLTLLTDFGTQDGFVGVMKGVIWGICPTVQIADISHQIQPQNLIQGAITLSRVAPFFGDGTIHVAVVDPGVGTHRRAIAAQLGTQLYVAPDNGLLTLLIQDAEEKQLPLKFVELNKREYWLNQVTSTFHGRDIFAPVGAHLAASVPLKNLGKPIDDPILLPFSKPEKTDSGWNAHISLIDTFGNLRTDLHTDRIKGEAKVNILGQEIDSISKSYGHHEVGDLVALKDSEGYLEIAVVNGNAEKRVDAKVGDLVEVVISPSS
ncbi:MAG: SAM-dependent chlorinase/fluorinase [Anaerolineae bacterium]|jgi:S-adenosyl-L-methionine hydrolase (adenosine-forming)|nr:SAM-dependent chlorinase/fluorinase [Anaerolineae bacterium]MBT4312662.1 SAM-dependent chlorinase/fluorinase [Anaerolineae bacterium]MBT4459405.1 SAM-dependent chlorinase/fluorinase [Anaerolineae bacterium]MBT6061071.1 SAM-dependent chlorinase/fluorinase [Anaerolineae bacterium]MBT6322972.1 SAM-dependent chlorinase/fluorinase [Anaerolineae bacterium]